MPYRQELVLQFSVNSLEDYDDLIELEDGIIEALCNQGKVDGHDVGVGEMNIFIRTDRPERAFEIIKSLPKIQERLLYFRAAIRAVGGDQFKILYPAELSHFSIA